MKKTISKIAALMLTASIAVSSIGTTVSAYYDTAVVNDYTAAAKNDDASDNETTSKNFNNSSYYTRLDKWGRAYPYQYYTFSGNYYTREMYEKVYNAIHEQEPSVVVTKEEYEAFKKVYKKNIVSFLIDIRENCDVFYYFKGSNYRKGSDYRIQDDGSVKITLKYTMSKEKIEKYNKQIDAAVAKFDKYLEKHNVTTTEEFLYATVAYLGETVKYDYSETANCRNIVGALIEGEVVCTGYARAFNYLCATHGISYANLTTKELSVPGLHSMSMVPCNNVWYIFDATWFDYETHQFVTEEQLKKGAKFARCKSNDHFINPRGNGKELPTTVTLEKPTVKEVEFTDSDMESFTEFKELYEMYCKSAMKNEMTTIKMIVPEGTVDTAIKYLKQLKKDGDYSYSKLYKGKNYVKIVL